MTQIKDGGPAFPLPYEHTEVVTRMQQLGEISTEQLLECTKQLRGVSVRDYFAIRAFQARLAKHNDWTLTEITDQAWSDADAMLRRRGTP